MTLVELERVAAGILLLAAAWPAFGPLAGNSTLSRKRFEK